MHWKGGIGGAAAIVFGWVISHIDPISALLPAQYAGTLGTLIGLAGTVVTMFSKPVGSPVAISDVVPPASPTAAK